MNSARHEAVGEGRLGGPHRPDIEVSDLIGHHLRDRFRLQPAPVLERGAPEF